MNTTWIKLIAEAIFDAIIQGKRMGLPDLAEDQLEKISKLVNAEVAKLLPLQFEALNIAVQLAAKNIIAQIDSLPKTERCPKCTNVLTIHLRDGNRWTSCDRCDFVSPVVPRR